MSVHFQSSKIKEVNNLGKRENKPDKRTPRSRNYWH